MIIQNLHGLRHPGDYQAIFFDFDGVLADTEPIHWRCWHDVLLGQGIDLSWDYYERECIGVSDRDMLVRLGALADPPQSADDLFHLYPLKKEMFRDACSSHSPIPQAVVAAVKSLQNVKLGVVTSSGKTEVEPILLKTQLLERLDVTVYGRDAGKLKPSPEPYLLAASKCGIERALVFEDSTAGVESADVAGHLVLRIAGPTDLPALLAQLAF